MSTSTYRDSRELLAELREMMEDEHYDYGDEPSELNSAYAEMDTEDRERIDVLRDALSKMPQSTVDSLHGNSWGATMVPESDFEDYAREFAEDIGALEGSNWPLYCIDWKYAARELAMDFTSVELDGVTYLCR